MTVGAQRDLVLTTKSDRWDARTATAQHISSLKVPVVEAVGGCGWSRWGQSGGQFRCDGVS